MQEHDVLPLGDVMYALHAVIVPPIQYVLTGQSVQTSCAFQFIPSGHTYPVHTVPGSTEVVLAAHSAHCPTPVLNFNVPAAHAVHSTPSPSAAYPDLQMQFVRALLAGAEFVPAGQC